MTQEKGRLYEAVAEAERIELGSDRDIVLIAMAIGVVFGAVAGWLAHAMIGPWLFT